MPTKPTIIVCKTGSPCDVGLGGSSRGDGDTPSIVEHLCERGDLDVVFFGPLRNWQDHKDGSPGWATTEGVTVMDPDLGSVFNGRTHVVREDAAAIEDLIAPMISDLRDRRVVGVIDVNGPEVGWSWPDNAADSGVMLWAARYGAPAKRMMHLLGAHRLSVITDPRCYTRDSEMTRMWPELVPHAVLSQEAVVFPRTISFHPMRIHAAYAACEYWLTHRMHRIGPPAGDVAERTIEVAIAANTHIKDARIGGGAKRGLPASESLRGSLWQDVLSCCPDDTAVCGSDWEDLMHDCPEHWYLGKLKSMHDVREMLTRAVGGPMIAQERGFNSTKIRLYALSGCMPYPYVSENDDYRERTYDGEQRVLPLDHPMRWKDGPPNWRALGVDPEEYVSLILERTKPNFTMLDRLVDHAVAGTIGWPSPEWLCEFGGYVPV